MPRADHARRAGTMRCPAPQLPLPEQVLAGTEAGPGAAPPASGAGTAGLLGEWPHVSALEFAGLPSAVPCGRLHTRQVLWEWGLDHLAADAELLVSEMLGNALKAAREQDNIGVVVLRLLANRQRLLIEVWDENPHDPQPRQVDELSERGRGFMVIEAVATRWGFRRVSARNKVVWAELLAKPA
jgi:anti-sigma regulatory factor (Ser/Thr protein kinase)